MPFFYILRCADNSLYVGHTDDLPSRVKTHNEARGGTYTAQRRPVRVVYSETYDTTAAAIARERQVKRWTRSKKDALIAGDHDLLKRLSKHRQARRPR